MFVSPLVSFALGNLIFVALPLLEIPRGDILTHSTLLILTPKRRDVLVSWLPLASSEGLAPYSWFTVGVNHVVCFTNYFQSNRLRQRGVWLNVYISQEYPNEWTWMQGNSRPKPCDVVPAQMNNKGDPRKCTTFASNAWPKWSVAHATSTPPQTDHPFLRSCVTFTIVNSDNKGTQLYKVTYDK